jgi:hypothetical protein
MPKAGTHLVRKLLQMTPRFRFYGLHVENRRFLKDLASAQNPNCDPNFNMERLENAIARTPQGQFITGHFTYQDILSEMFDNLGFKVIMMLRDPRDVVVSHAKYVARLERHILHSRYIDELKDDNERLMASIRGLSIENDKPGLIDIGTRMRRYQPWMNRSETQVCHFEALIGAKGGGSREQQISEVDAILHFIDRPQEDKVVSELADRVWAPNSATFRKGQIGDWRNHFSEEHKEAFKKVAGMELISFGYESNLDW